MNTVLIDNIGNGQMVRNLDPKQYSFYPIPPFPLPMFMNNNQFFEQSSNLFLLIAGQTQHFKDAFSGRDASIMGLPLAFYYGMYAYAGW